VLKNRARIAEQVDMNRDAWAAAAGDAAYKQEAELRLVQAEAELRQSAAHDLLDTGTLRGARRAHAISQLSQGDTVLEQALRRHVGTGIAIDEMLALYVATPR
jgi:hypothetical protein